MFPTIQQGLGQQNNLVITASGEYFGIRHARSDRLAPVKQLETRDLGYGSRDAQDENIMPDILDRDLEWHHAVPDIFQARENNVACQQRVGFDDACP